MNKLFIFRQKLMLFIFLAVSILCLSVIRNISLGESRDNRYSIYSVRFEYFGMDAAEIEKTITIPLEEKIGSLSDLYEIRSYVEYGKSTTTAYFKRDINKKNVYLALRNIVDTLYVALPKSVQKPRIYSSSSENKAILSIAVTAPGNLTALRKHIENNLKRDFEGIDGIAEVLVAGGSIDEIRVEFDPDILTEMGINPVSLGQIIQDANVISAGGTLYRGQFNENIILNTKVANLDQIKQLPVKANDKMTSLEYFSNIAVSQRASNEIVRINGMECIGIQIKAASDANIVKISKECQSLIKSSDIPENSIFVLYDTGKLFNKMINNVVVAFIQSFALISFLILFFYKSKRILIMLMLVLPVTCVWTITVISILGFNIDQNVLSGITISLGLIIDSMLIVSAVRESNINFDQYINKLKNTYGAIIASVLTTVMVLVPLYFFDNIVPGIRSVSITIIVMLSVSLALACIFFPIFIFSEKQDSIILFSKIRRALEKYYSRFSLKLSLLSLKYSRHLSKLYFFLLPVPFVLFFVSGKNITLDVKDNVVYASVEYEPERTAASIDSELKTFIEMLMNLSGVNFVRMESRNGNADLEIVYDEKKASRADLMQSISATSRHVPSGFLYLPELGIKRNRNIQEIEIAVVGDDIRTCRDIAKTGASYISMMPGIIQTVLNFKEPEKNVVFTPDKELLVKSEFSVHDIASALRWVLFGPVVDKWIQSGGEMDIRVAGKNFKDVNLDKVMNQYISTPYGGIRLGTLGETLVTQGTGKIYRRDGRRAAYFTVSMNSSSTDKAITEIKKHLSHIETEKGYGFLLPRDLENLNSQYKTLFFVFLGCICGIALILTALTENITRSLLIASIIPISCILPLLIKFFLKKPLEMGDIVGLMVISGISINNAIYIINSAKTNIVFKFREKIKSVLITSLTSVFSAVPLIIMNKEGFSRALADSILWGTVGSLAAALLLFPALCKRMT
ncbi:MAG: efflux RND transporter permease subunit [Treponema sp.]|jgi:multidrug efflux pump subunit AcrB|nr:efflux RND transporter permease subunit [Treponema sp.]